MIILDGEIVAGTDAIGKLRDLITSVLSVHAAVSGVLPCGADSRLLEELSDCTLRHVLIAGSRTTAGGDGYFVLEDLYGSDGLLFCPETQPVNAGTISASTSASALDDLIRTRPCSSPTISVSSSTDDDERQSAGLVLDLEIDRRKRSASNEAHSVLGRNKVSVSVTKKGVRVVLTEAYDLFARADIEASATAEVAPLISFDLTIKTLVKFDSLVGTAVAASADALDVLAEASSRRGSSSTNEGAERDARYIETLRDGMRSSSDAFCRRSLSIVPRLG